MSPQQVLDADAISAFERHNIERLRQLSFAERGELFAAVCRDAAEIEASRIKMGLPPSRPAPGRIPHGSIWRRPPGVSEKANKRDGAVETAKQLAAALDEAGCEYALGGAIALGFWTAPRGTLDVDVTALPTTRAAIALRAATTENRL